MQSSIFNVRVPLEDRGEVFLMNTFTDAQLIVSRDVSDLLDRLGTDVFAASTPTREERDAIDTLAENGFIVDSRETDRRNIENFFVSFRENSDQLRVTVLTTLQCNFACDYCLQGDHGDWNKTAAKMSMETAARLGDWIEARLAALGSKSFALTFFGGEPLLNMPVVDYLSERMWNHCQARGIGMYSSIVTNGLLLTPEIVDRLTPYGLGGVKITLDGDRDTHNRMRPLRGGQGTFDKILRNIRLVADKVKISIGGNFDESSVDSYPALIQYLREQDFADKLQKVSFKPIIREQQPPQPKGFIALTPVSADGKPSKPLNGACMSSAGAGVTKKTSTCDSCSFLDEKTSYLREETMKARLQDRGRRPHGAVRDPQDPRAYGRPRRIALRLPGLRDRDGRIDRPHRRPPRRSAHGGGEALRPDHRLARMSGLLVHPGLRRRLFGGVARGAGRHAEAELPQALVRGGRDLAGAPGGARTGHRLTRVSKLKHSEIERRKEARRERQKGHQEEGRNSSLAGGRVARSPAVRRQFC